MKLQMAAASLLGLSLFFAASALTQPAPIYDVVIRNGRLLDGSGNPWVNAAARQSP
jgi:N-acyl-D-amino-acid deacylase